MSLTGNNPRFELLQHLLLKPVLENVLTAIMFGDAEGNLIEVNDAACKMFGYTKTELLQFGRSGIIIMDDTVKKLLNERMETGRSAGIINFKRKNGEIFKGKVSTNIINDGQGDAFICIAVVDISEEEKLQSILNEVSEMAMIGGFVLDIITGKIAWTTVTKQIHEVPFDYEPDIESVLQFFKVGESRNRMMQCLNKIKTEHHGWDEKFLIVTAKGNERWVRSIGEPELINGELIAIKGSVQDIHKEKMLEEEVDEQRKKIEEGIRFNETRFRLIIENLSIGIVKHKPNAEIMLCNRAALKMLGLSKEKFLGSSVHDLSLNVIHRDGTDFPANELPVSLALANKKVVKNIEMGIFRQETNDRVWLLVNATPQLFDNGDLECVTVTFTDITEKIRMEAEMSSQLNRYRMLMQTSQDAIHILDTNGKLLEWNEAFTKHLGYAQNEMTNMNVLDWNPFLDRSHMLKIMGTVQNEGISFEALHQLKNGSIKNVEVKLHKFFVNDETFFYASARDITELKQKQKEIEKLNDELRELSAHQQQLIEKERAELAKKIHDEFAQKFVAINMNAEMIKRKINGDNAELHKLINNQIGMAHEVIKASRKLFNLLYPTMLEDLGLIDTLRSCCEEQMRSCDITLVLNTNIEEEKLPKEINLALFRIFQEALNNVMLFAKASRVVANINIEEGSIVMEIEDNGIGFDAAAVNTKEHHGLLVMRERAYAINGKFRVDSVPGEGTTVQVKIPLPE